MQVGAVHVAAPADGRPKAESIQDAAEQFEALLITQLLKSMREAGSGGWLGTGEEESGGLMMEVAEGHLARVLASQGGLGVANLVVKGLEGAETAQENGTPVR